MTQIIAIDAMGGDHAPSAPLEGVAKIIENRRDIFFKIFGDKHAIDATDILKDHHRSHYEIIHTDEWVTNDTPAREALRSLKKSSMRLAIQEVAKGQAAGVVSSGNTGAYMALAKIILKTLPNITRPAIARSLPTQKGASIMLDLGANVEVTALNLVEFAVMGDALARCVLNCSSPSVGLLNVGSEELKGNAIVRQAQEMLRTQKVLDNFYGFIEGDDIFAGTTDVVVADGFSGNIALKTAEGCARFFSLTMKQAMHKKLHTRLGALLAASAFREIKERFDPRNYNGAPFLGLQGIAVKSHGGSDGKGFTRAIEVTLDLILSQVNDKILLGIAKIKPDTDDGILQETPALPNFFTAAL